MHFNLGRKPIGPKPRHEDYGPEFASGARSARQTASECAVLHFSEPFREVLILISGLGRDGAASGGSWRGGRTLPLASVTLVIAGEPTTTADPCEGAFDDPALGQDHEAVLVAAAHDLSSQLPVQAMAVAILRP